MAKLLYQGHASLRITTDECDVIYVDPYAGEGYDRQADLVLVSHEHFDHNQVRLVTLKKGGRVLPQRRPACRRGVPYRPAARHRHRGDAGEQPQPSAGCLRRFSLYGGRREAVRGL